MISARASWLESTTVSRHTNVPFGDIKMGHEMKFNFSLMTDQVSSAVLKRHRNIFEFYGRRDDWRKGDCTRRRGLRYGRIDMSRYKVEWICNEYIVFVE